MEKVSQFVARVFLGHIFLLAGLSKIGAYEGTQGYMDAMGVPGMLLPLVILLEIGGGLAIIAGWKTKWTAIALAAFSATTPVSFAENTRSSVRSTSIFSGPLNTLRKLLRNKTTTSSRSAATLVAATSGRMYICPTELKSA